MSKQPHQDIDLMLYVDGELDDDEARAIAEVIANDPAAEAKVESLRQMGEVLRTYAELAVDDQEAELDAMWSKLERRIRANGAAAARETADEAEPAPEPMVERKRARRAAPASPGLWAALNSWLEGYRSNILTGAVAVAAVALLILALRSSQTVVIDRTQPVVPVNNPTAGGVGPTMKPQPVPLVEEPRPPEVTDLDIVDGSGSVFVMPSEGEGDISATVVFVDMNDVEGPL